MLETALLASAGNTVVNNSHDDNRIIAFCLEDLPRLASHHDRENQKQMYNMDKPAKLNREKSKGIFKYRMARISNTQSTRSMMESLRRSFDKIIPFGLSLCTDNNAHLPLSFSSDQRSKHKAMIISGNK